ncbi:MAG: hypothetical protein HZA52_15090 [Planctomycetes bacterium]|nr:hypothetical protein [Planctomycetota bacterium]
MSPHASDPHDHEAQPSRAHGARRDLLGLSSLLGPDAGLVPISDLDAGAAWGAEERALPSACGACTTRCAPNYATGELALARSETCDLEPEA